MQRPGGAAQKSGRAAANKPAPLRVPENEVIAALESLYDDEVKPYGRILLKRLGERAAATSDPAASFISLPAFGDGDAELVPRIDTARLRQVCERSRWIRVVKEGAEYAALLQHRPEQFVDASSNDDPYPAHLWAAMSDFFRAGGGQHLVLPGGRYACARALMGCDLPFLRGYTLGRVSHIVQLAISQRSILGYADSKVVAYERSENVVKQLCAEEHRPAPRRGVDLRVADLEAARAALLAIFRQRGGQPLPLPNVKRIFRSEFQLELSETSFGHCRLCDLLQDARFSDLCTLAMEGNTFMLVPAPVVPEPPAATEGATLLQPHGACHEPPLETVHGFIHFKVPLPTSVPLRRTRSVPAEAHHRREAWSDKESDDGRSTCAGTHSDQVLRRDSFSSDVQLPVDALSHGDDSSSDACFDYPSTPSPRSPQHLRRGSLGAGSPFFPEPSPAAFEGCRPFGLDPLPLESLEFLEADTLSHFPLPTPSPSYDFHTIAAMQSRRQRCYGAPTETPVQDFACPTTLPQHQGHAYHLAR